MLPLNSYAQFIKELSYRAETGVSFSGGEHTPFWLTANKQGLSSIEKNNGYLRAGVFRELENDKRFSYAFGADWLSLIILLRLLWCNSCMRI